MSLGLLAPLALLLGALLAGPVLAHMAQQRPSQRQAFGAMLLLRRLVKRLEKRRRIRDRWLLLLRLLALALLILAASRPQLSWPGDSPEFGGSGAVVLVLDDSMSMGQRQGGRTLMSRARDQALELVRELPPGASVGLVRIGGQAERVTATLSQEHGPIIAALEGMEAGYGRTDLEGGLREARRLLAGQPGEVLVFSDEAGPNLVASAVGELRKLVELGAAVIPRPVAAKPPRNVAVLAAEYGDGLEGGTVTVVVMNYGPDPVEVPCTVGLPDGSEITAFLELEPGARAEERFTVPQTVPGGVAWARVSDEHLPLDDARYFHLPRVGASRVVVIDGDPGSTPVRSEVYFLERALAPWGGRRGGVLPEVRSPVGLSNLDADVHQVVFMANVADASAASSVLTDFVRGGGGLVVSMGNNVTADRYNGPLRDLLPAPLSKPRDLVDLSASGGVPLALPDVSLPLFAPFIRAGRAAFTRMNTRRVMALQPYNDSPPDAEDGVSTLLRFEGGVPALVERRVGKGTVLLWTSTIDLDWGNGALQSAFMPFVQRLVGYLGGEAGGGAKRATGVVGELTTIALPSVGLEPVVTDSDGKEVSAELQRGDDLQVLFTPRAPGAFTVGIPGEPPMAWVAVNAPPEESDVRVGERLASAEATIVPELFLRRVELGLPALGLAVMLLLGQALLSGMGRRE